MPKPLVLAIAGCSGSGKTTLAHELATQLDATLFALDLYYRDLSHLPSEARPSLNFDHPDSLESELILTHVRALAAGKPIQRPVYDFKTHTRVPNAFDPITPTSVVLVEGILALHYAELLPFYTFSVYVDAPNQICLRRRVYRDMLERGRTEQSIHDQWAATARPMAEQFVLPSAAHADLIVNGTESLDWSIEQILTTLHRRNLLPAT